MRQFILLINLTFLSIFSFAQNDSIENEILNYSDSYPEIIMKGRGLLTQKFMEGDYKKVAEIKGYLENKIQDTQYVVFYPLENLFLSYWTKDYNYLLKTIPDAEPGRGQYRQKIKPAEDLLLEKLIEKTRNSIDALEANIQSSDLMPVDKDFLSLHLKFAATAGHVNQSDTDSINVLANNFLGSYPDSKYEKFVRQYIRYELTYSKWAFTFEFFGGYSVFTGDLNNTFNNPIPIGIAFDVYYKRWVLYLRNYIGFSKTKVDIPYKYGVWNKGLQANIIVPEASLGYVLLDNKFLKLAPFAGFGGTYISPTENEIQKDPDLKNAEFKIAATYSVGFNTDIKLGRSKMPILTFGDEERYVFLRLRYTYDMPQMGKKYGLSGNLHNITIGIGGFGRRIKRAY